MWFLTRWKWFRRWRGGYWASHTGLLWGRNWIQVPNASQCEEAHFGPNPCNGTEEEG